MVEPEFVLGGLEAIFDRPAMAFDADQGLDRCSGRTPGGEVGEIAIGDIAPDQQASRPQAMAFIVELFAFEIGQFEVAPVMQSRPLVPVPADRRCQSARRCALAISSAVPTTGCGLPQDPNQWAEPTPST